jgi:hypothetical protein
MKKFCCMAQQTTGENCHEERHTESKLQTAGHAVTGDAIDAQRCA